MQIEAIGNYQSKWGEGPVWWQNKLYYVDIEGHKVICFDPKAQEERFWRVGERVGAVIPRQNGGLLIAGDSGFRSLDTETGALEAIADPEPEKANNRFNDGKCSPDGRLFAGTISLVKETGDAALYCLEKDLTVKKVFGDVTNSNGLAWSSDGTRVFYIDTPTRMIQSFEYDSTSGEWSNAKKVVDTGHLDFSPDGMAIDAEDKLWVAFCHGGCVVRFCPESGEELRRIEFPCVETTSCAWGGEEFNELYVTTGIHKSLVEEKAGRLFVVKGLGIQGAPVAAFG